MRVAELCDPFAHKALLGRDMIESILAELAANNYIQRHGYKNRYGGDQNLYRLVDMKLIYGNFGAGSQTVELFHGSRRLGDVPAINLMRVHKGSSVRFAGKCWHVQKISRTNVELEPCRPTSQAVDFLYTGDGPHTDAFVADRTWRLIHSADVLPGLFAGELKQRVKRFCEAVRKACSPEQIPFERSTDGIRYFTFGGHLVNKAVGLASRKPAFEADDFSLLVSSPIEWSSIPKHPGDYEQYFHLLFEPSSEQSIYQQQLPRDLQLREYLQDWLKDEAIPIVLDRLSGARTVQVNGLSGK